MTRYDTYARLEPRPGDRDLQRGFEAAVHDPYWFLARQWQMGEHQGENASTPLVVNYRLDAARIGPPAGWEGFDPTLSPAEAAVEAGRDDWWTMGRRVGAGQRVGASARAEARAAAADPRARFRTPPPPYGRFDGRPDGLALWHLRAALGLTPADFGPDAPPADRPEAWQPDRLVYDQDYPAGGATLRVRDHRGDALDWYSADASADFTPDEVGPPRRVLPAPLEYPGAPNPRWWQIEDPATDVGGYPPDPAHFPTMLLIDLISSHGDDWFMVPVSARAGRAVVLADFSVRDSFGRTYERSGPGGEGLRPPADWHLFRCRGAAAGALVLWNVAELPLEGPVLERVQFGIDEAANLLWAVERVVGGREFAAREVPPVDPVAHPAYPAAAPSGDATRERRWAYVPGEGAPPGWHPYALDGAAAGDRAFAQHRLVDYSRQVAFAAPKPAADVLRAGPPESPALHRLTPAAVPSGGVEIERRRMLARDCLGNPLLWTQKQRRPLRAPPARTLRYDGVAETTDPE